jgi:starvation-inducible outer membrane lipoprotein
MGHQLDDYLLVRHQNDIVALWHNTPTVDIHSELSKYGAKNSSEFVAEAWSEFRNNPEPRPIAKKIGEKILSLYKIKVAKGQEA